MAEDVRIHNQQVKVMMKLVQEFEEKHLLLQEQFENFLNQWSSEETNKIKKTRLHELVKSWGSEFSPLYKILKTGKIPQTIKFIRNLGRQLTEHTVSWQEFSMLAKLLRDFFLAYIQQRISSAKRLAYSEAFNDFFFMFVKEISEIFLLYSDKLVLAKTRESAVLFHTTQSITTELDLDSLLSKIVFHAGMLLRGSHVYLFLKDAKLNGDARLFLKAWNQIGQTYGEYSLGFGEGPIGTVAETKESLLDNHYAKAYQKIPFLNHALSILIVPITFSEEVLGVLLAAESRRSKRFTVSQKELFLMYGQQIGIALKNVLLYQEQTKISRELEEKNKILEAQADLILKKTAQMVVLNEVSQQVNSSLELHEVMSLLARQAAESIGVNRCIVWLFDDKKVRLDAVAAFGFSKEQLEKLTFHLADIRDTAFFKTLATLKASQIQITDEGDGNTIFEKYLKKYANIKSFLAVPLILKDEAIGLLAVDDTREFHDYLEDEITLISAITNQTVMAIENARLYQKVKEQAITDGLTGVYNHRFFQLRLTDEFSHAKRYGNDLTLLMMDIDHFKQYNDTYGHMAGDLALKEIAQLLRASVRENDVVARYGGEEFVIILPMTPLEGARIVAERIRQAVRECKFLGDLNVPLVTITISCGLAIYHKKMGSREDLIKEADLALYTAKKSGRNQTISYPSI